MAFGSSAGFGVLVAIAIVAILVYVYLSLAYVAIAKKTRQSSPALAWIPFVGPFLIAFKASKNDWWPWLLLIGLVIPFIGGILILAFYVFAIIWHWKLFEKIGKPNWWSILLIIPIVNLIIIGIVAWSK